MTLRIIDIETTGTDPATDAIVEIASIDLKAGGAFTNVQQSLVFPGRDIPPEASAVHHILDRDVIGAPRIRECIDHFDGSDFYVAHNFKFERDFLEPIFGPKTWICTYRCSVMVFRHLKSFSNNAIRYALGLVDPLGISRHEINPHRALPDCYVTGAILTELLKVASFTDLLKWTVEPLYLPRFNFGKHKGEPIESVPIDYLIWMTTAKDMDEDDFYTAKFEIERRRQAA